MSSFWEVSTTCVFKCNQNGSLSFLTPCCDCQQNVTPLGFSLRKVATPLMLRMHCIACMWETQ